MTVTFVSEDVDASGTEDLVTATRRAATLLARRIGGAVSGGPVRG